MTIDNVLGLLRPAIRALKSYDNLRGATEDNAIILDSNENVCSPTQQFTQEQRYRYPQIRPQQLIDRLADIYAVSPAQVLMGRGSDDIIDVLIRAFCESGKDSILQTTPCFSMYAISATIQGATIKSVALDRQKDFQYQLTDIIAAINSDVKLVFLASPQSPTGQLLARPDLVLLLENAQQQVVVIDEAYIEFSQADSVADMLADYPNLVIMRTLSKAYGLANLRCGALLAHPALIAALRPVLTPYALSGLVVEAAYNALQPEQVTFIQNKNRSIAGRKDKLIQGLESLKDIRTIYPGQANFVLCEMNETKTIINYLETKNIFIRSYSPQSELRDFIRVSVGTDSEIDCLLGALKEFAA